MLLLSGQPTRFSLNWSSKHATRYVPEGFSLAELEISTEGEQSEDTPRSALLLELQASDFAVPTTAGVMQVNLQA